MIGCGGLPTALGHLKEAEAREHLLACAMIDNEQQEPLVFCYRCGAYSSKRCVLLGQRCLKKLGKSGAQTLFRIKQGLHPHYDNDSRVSDPCRRSAASVLEAATAQASNPPASRSRLIATEGMQAIAARIRAREAAALAAASTPR